MCANATLMDIARAYVRAAIEMLAKECPEGPPRVQKELDWVRTSANSFALCDREEPYWAVDQLLSRLSKLSEHADLLAALRVDPVIGPQVDGLVGIALGLSRLSAVSVANRLLWETAHKTGPLRFDDERFNSAFQKIDSGLRKSHFDFVLVAPLWQVKIDSLPVQFSPSLEIDGLTDEEIVRCLNASYFPQLMFGGFVHFNSAVGVRFRCQLPKRVGDLVSPKQVDYTAFDIKQRGSEELARVLHILRLFKAGRVSTPGAVFFSGD